METFAENGLTANQLHLCPEITNSTGQDSPLSEPRHDPSNQSVPEIMVTECSPTKPGLDSTSILDWSMSCNSVSGTSSDLQQNGIETSADGSQSWSNANAGSDFMITVLMHFRLECFVQHRHPPIVCILLGHFLIFWVFFFPYTNYNVQVCITKWNTHCVKVYSILLIAYYVILAVIFDYYCAICCIFPVSLSLYFNPYIFPCNL